MMEVPPRIPFNRPSLVGNELEYMRQSVEGGHAATGGPFTAKASELLREWHDSDDVLLTTSCTDALEISALLLDIKPGETVIVPSFTFVSSALAFVRAGARILFADIEPVTLGIDPAHVAELMDNTVRAVVAVHYAGVGCDLAGLEEVLADWPQVALVEDNAQGLFGTYRGRPLGTFGRHSAISFHETKNFICGEGGALVINRSSDVERAHILLDKGTNRREFMLGQIDKYSWVDTGSSFGLSDILAAYLLAQLEQRRSILDRRARIYEGYEERLAGAFTAGHLTAPIIPADRTSSYHMYYVLFPNQAKRDRALHVLSAAGIRAAFHYVPLHSSAGGIRFSDRSTSCPVTNDVSSRLLRLPFYNDMAEGDLDRVVARIDEAAN